MAKLIIVVDFHEATGLEFVREGDARDTLELQARDLLGGEFFDFRRAFEFDIETGATRDVTAELVRWAVQIGHDEKWDDFRDVDAWFVRNGHVREEDFSDLPYGDPNAEHGLGAFETGVSCAMGRFA